MIENNFMYFIIFFAILIIFALFFVYRKKLLFFRKIKIKLFLTDVDGVLTDAGMYYSESGDELKKFNTKDGKGFELLRKSGIQYGIITSENTKIVADRAKKLRVNYLFQAAGDNKLDIVKNLCKSEGFLLDEIAYIGDDINDVELLMNVGLSACPLDSVKKIKSINNIKILSKKGGEGVVREFIDLYVL